MHDLVYWSVAEVNRKNRGVIKSIGQQCKCGADQWKVRHGISDEYRSQYNPGEYVEWICAACGFSFQEGC